MSDNRVTRNGTEIEALINKRLLKAETRNNAQSVLKALYAFFDRTLN